MIRTHALLHLRGIRRAGGRTIAFALVAGMTAGVFVSCSAPAADPPAAGDAPGERPEGRVKGTRPPPGIAKGDGAVARRRQPQPGGGGARRRRVASGDDLTGGTASRSGDGPTGRASPRAGTRRSLVVDYARDTDAYGDAPAYGDITRALLIDRGRRAELVLTLRADLPRRMGTETYMTVGFRFEIDGDEAYAYLNGDTSGWRPDMRSPDGRTFTGDFAIRDRKLHIMVPWARLGNPKSLRWSATTSWVRSSSDETEYQFDSAPDHDPQRFRRSPS